MTALDLDAIKARADGATPGPWDYITQGVVGHASQSSEDTMDNPVIWVRKREEDGAFAAHARTDVPALVAEVERQAAIIAGIREACADRRSGGSPLLSGNQILAILDSATMPYCAECGCSTPNGLHFSHCPLQRPESSDSSSTGGQL